MPGSGLPGSAYRASVWSEKLLGGQQRLGKRARGEGLHGCEAGSSRPEKRKKDPQGPGADRKTEIQWERSMESESRTQTDASGETQTQRDPHRGTETRKERDRNSQGEVIGEIQTGGVTESCGATETARDRDPHEETATRTQRETGTHKENHRPSGSPADGDATASGS